MSDSNELALTLAELQDFIPATMSLYEGRMVKTETELFFIAERFSGWEIMERCERLDVQKVEVSESFMGRVVEIHTNGSHWSLKEVSEGVDVEAWIKGSSRSTEQSHRQIVESPIVEPQPDTPDILSQSVRLEQEPTSVGTEPLPTVDLPEVTPEDLDRMRQVLTVNSNMQTVMAKFLDEVYDGTDEQIIRLFHKKPDLLSTLRQTPGMKFSILKLILSLGGSKDTPLPKRLITGCLVLLLLLPFLGTFLAFFVEACFG